MRHIIDEDIIFKSILQYGRASQSTVCMEECAELIQAISKAKRGKLDADNLTEEMADVLICIEMLKQLYDIVDSDINAWIETKQRRTLERMQDEDTKRDTNQSQNMEL